MTDPNLDLGLDYTGGITKPTSDQVGYYARVDSSGTNLEYVSLLLFGAAIPFRAVYYVDPNFLGAQSGSASNPFTSIAAAFVYAQAQGLTHVLILLPAGQVIVEDVVFPEGGDYEIASQGTLRATISGTLNMTSVTQGVRRLTHITVTGVITGASSTGTGGGNFLWATNCALLGNITFTGLSLGFWWFICTGRTSNFFSFGGFCNGTVTGTFELMASDWSFNGAIAPISVSQMRNCRLPTSVSIGATGTNALQLVGCTFSGGAVVTGTGTISLDGFSFSSFVSSNVTVASTIVVTTLAGRRIGNTTGFTGNFSAFNLSGVGAIEPAGFYEISVSLVKTVAGTAGIASFNVGCTDADGVFTMPVVTLDVTSESRKSGTLCFRSNGTAHVTLAATGITTPGSLAASYKWALTKLD